MTISRKWLWNLRLSSGLVLFAFIFSHFGNHALGLISWPAMEAGREVFIAIWRNPFSTILLITSIALHGLLVFYALFIRRTWRGIRRSEIIQIIFGLAIPALIVMHIIGTRILHEEFGITDSYAFVIVATWISSPANTIMQTLALVLAWVHGCLGIHFWLRLKPWYGRTVPYLYTIAILVPVLSLLGFVNGAREVAELWESAEFRRQFAEDVGLVPAAAPWAYATRDVAYNVMIGFLVVFGGLRGLAYVIERRRGLVRVSYPDGRTIAVQPGMTILEASQQGGVPHAAVCGGRGRCSTCRVRIVESAADLPDPSEAENRVLRRVGATEGVRLACQTRPGGDVTIIPLLPANAQPRDGFSRPAYLQGSERDIAILFADLRSFTKFSEQKLPYDVVFVINQYFRYMGTAIESADGKLDKFIGDGVMALFGIESGPEQGCRDVLKAARQMSQALIEMNQSLKNDLPDPMRIGIGIHVGSVIVGEMGYASAVSLTAIGDAVNTASRLEVANKEFGSQLVVSRRVAETAGVDLSAFPSHELEVRGRQEPLTVYVLDDANDLPADIAEAAPRRRRARAGG